MKRFHLCLILCFLFSPELLLAQTPGAIEADLLTLFKKIDIRSESDTAANNAFGRKLAFYAEKHPSTITQNFTLLKKANVDIATSTDGLLRIYSWEMFTNGDVHWFDNIIQYKAGPNTFSGFSSTRGWDYGDIRPKYNQIFTFKSNLKTYYLEVYTTGGSSRNVVGGIKAYTIDHGKLIYANLFQTIAHIRTNELNYGYDFSSVANDVIIKKPIVTFDSKSSTIRLIMADTTGRRLAYKHIIFKFNGQYFEKIK